MPNGQCYGCGMKYGDVGWCDVIVPDDVWEQINPSPHKGGGLLCFNCIATRLDKVGLSNVEVKITSGPFRR